MHKITESHYIPPLPVDIKLIAKRKYEDFYNKYKGRYGYSSHIQLSFQENAISPVSYSYENNIIENLYDLSWIKSNLDYPTLLNNFIYLFEFSDLKMRIDHTSKSVSYTHLDVYKRQLPQCAASAAPAILFSAAAFSLSAA